MSPIAASHSVTFYSDACVTPIAAATVAPGAEGGRFHFRSLSGGKVTVTLSGNGLTPVSQEQTVVSLVHSGTCTLTNPNSLVLCPISPALNDVSKAMLFFQATGGGSAVSETNVRCRPHVRE